MALRHFIDGTYAHRPIELARFAPLVFAHRTDPVAARLIKEAEQYLVSDFSLVHDTAMPGPVALGGGVIGQFIGLRDGVAEVIRRAGHEPDIRLVADGSTGAIVLAHDIHPGTVEAMPSTFAELEAKGFKFVTVSELLGMATPETPHPKAEPAEKTAAKVAPSAVPASSPGG